MKLLMENWKKYLSEATAEDLVPTDIAEKFIERAADVSGKSAEEIKSDIANSPPLDVKEKIAEILAVNEGPEGPSFMLKNAIGLALKMAGIPENLSGKIFGKMWAEVKELAGAAGMSVGKFMPLYIQGFLEHLRQESDKVSGAQDKALSAAEAMKTKFEDDGKYSHLDGDEAYFTNKIKEMKDRLKAEGIRPLYVRNFVTTLRGAASKQIRDSNEDTLQKCWASSTRGKGNCPELFYCIKDPKISMRWYRATILNPYLEQLIDDLGWTEEIGSVASSSTAPPREMELGNYLKAQTPSKCTTYV